MANLYFSGFMFLVHFMYRLLLHAVSLQIATLTQSTLRAMAADDASQTTPVQLSMFSYCVVLHKLHMCNFDSHKYLNCYMVCIN